MRAAGLMVLALALAASAQPAEAADPPPTLWSADVGVALLRAPVYAGAKRSTDYLFPQLGFTYGTRLRGSLDDGVRWSALKSGIVQAGPVVEYREADRLRKVVPGRGMRGAVEAGGFVEVDTLVAELEGRVRRAVDGYGGWSADLAADTGIEVGRWKLGAEARAAWADQRFVYDRYGPQTLGREESDGRIARPVYLTAGVEGDVGFRLTPRLTLGVLLSRDEIISHFQSQARQRRGIVQAGTGLSFHFGTASAR